MKNLGPGGDWETSSSLKVQSKQFLISEEMVQRRKTSGVNIQRTGNLQGEIATSVGLEHMFLD